MRDGEQLRFSSPAILIPNNTGKKKADEARPYSEGFATSAYLFTSFSAYAELLLIESSEVEAWRGIVPLPCPNA